MSLPSPARPGAALRALWLAACLLLTTVGGCMLTGCRPMPDARLTGHIEGWDGRGLVELTVPAPTPGDHHADLRFALDVSEGGSFACSYRPADGWARQGIVAYLLLAHVGGSDAHQMLPLYLAPTSRLHVELTLSAPPGAEGRTWRPTYSGPGAEACRLVTPAAIDAAADSLGFEAYRAAVDRCYADRRARAEATGDTCLIRHVAWTDEAARREWLVRYVPQGTPLAEADPAYLAYVAEAGFDAPDAAGALLYYAELLGRDRRRLTGGSNTLYTLLAIDSLCHDASLRDWALTEVAETYLALGAPYRNADTIWATYSRLCADTMRTRALATAFADARQRHAQAEP